MKAKFYNTLFCLLTFLIVVSGLHGPLAFMTDQDNSGSNQLQIFTIWFDGRINLYSPGQESGDFSSKNINPVNVFAYTDRLSLIKKTYNNHNQLHFNIPLICYKFPVSQHTCDG